MGGATRYRKETRDKRQERARHTDERDNSERDIQGERERNAKKPKMRDALTKKKRCWKKTNVSIVFENVR
jgi:hypothetical protein